MAELALAAIAAGGAVYSGVKQSQQAKAMRSQLQQESDRVTAVEDGQKKVRMGGRGMLAFSDEDLTKTMGGSTDASGARTLGGATG